MRMPDRFLIVVATTLAAWIALRSADAVTLQRWAQAVDAPWN